MHAIKKLFLETHPQIKFEDVPVKQNILIVCIGLALVPFFFFKWPIFKNQREDSMDVVQYFSCVF